MKDQELWGRREDREEFEEVLASEPPLRFRTDVKHAAVGLEMARVHQPRDNRRHGLVVQRQAAPPLRPHTVAYARLLQAQRKQLLRGDVSRRRRWGDRLDVSLGPQVQQARSLQQRVRSCGQEECVPLGAETPPGASEPLQERCHRARSVNLDHAVEVTDVNAEFERRRRDDHAVARLCERRLRSAPLVN